MDNQQYLTQDEKKALRVRKIRNWAFVLILAAGLVWFTSYLSGQEKKYQPQATSIQATENDIVVGNKDAKIELMEYSDFQCPACASYHFMMDQLLIDYQGKIKLVYRHFPLERIHKNAIIGAKAGEASAKQGKFEEMAHIMFTKQSDWAGSDDARSLLIGYSVEAGMDMQKFINDIDSPEVEQKVKSDQLTAESIGLDSTPTFFVNGRQIANPANLDGFKQIIDEELKKLGE